MDQMTTPVEPGDIRDLSDQAIDRRTRQRTRAVESIQDGLIAMDDALIQQDGFRYHRIGELIHPETGMIVGYRYAGNEFTLSIVNAPGYPAGFGTIPVRLTQAVIERDPDAVVTLTEIIRLLIARRPFQVHVDAGMTLLGLECEGRLFGFRTPVDAQAVDGPVDARIDAIHGPGAAAALDQAIADGVFGDGSADA